MACGVESYLLLDPGIVEQAADCLPGAAAFLKGVSA